MDRWLGGPGCSRYLIRHSTSWSIASHTSTSRKESFSWPKLDARSLQKPATRIRRRNVQILKSRIHPATVSKAISLPTTLLELSLRLDPYMTPIYAGFISMVIRMIPYEDYTSVMLEKEKGIKKELQAAIGIYNPETLIYDPIFDDSYEARFSRMVYNLPLDAPLHSKIHRSFVKANLLFPDVSTTRVCPRRLYGTIRRFH